MQWSRTVSTGVRLGLLATSALAIVGLAQPAAARQATAEPNTVDEVFVTGFRSSLAKALDLKRESNAVVDSIVAEDIAKFPDNNLAESIQRIPGVAITRDQGEGRALSVRGLGPDFTRVRINGMEAQAATDGLAGGVNRGRGFDFNVFASELFSRIDVRKTASANVPEGSLGATVDLFSGHPFDYPGLKIAASAQANYNDQGERFGKRGAFLVSNTFADDTFGALFSVAYSEIPLDAQQSNSGGWNQGTGDGGFCRPTTGTGGLCDVPAGDLTRYLEVYGRANAATTYNPRFYRYVHSKGTIERLGLTGSLQWRPDDRTDVAFDMLFSRFDSKRDDYMLEPIGFSRGASQGGKPETLVRDIVLDANGTAIYGLFDNVDMRSEHAKDDFQTTFGQWTLRGSHAFNDRLTIDGLVGFSYSDFDNANDIVAQIDRFNVDGYAFDIRPSGQYKPALNYNFNVADATNWYFGPRVTQPGGTGSTGPELRLRPNYTDNKYKTALANLAYRLNDGLTLRAGLELKKYDFAVQQYRFTAGEADWPTLPAGSTLASVTETFCGLDKIAPPAPSPTCWTVPNIGAFAQTYGLYSNTGRATLATTNAAARGDNKKVSEEDTAVYVMADFNRSVGDMRLRGDVGIRWVKTDQTASFYTNVPVAVSASGFVYTTVDREYDDWLPSANLVLEAREDLLVRLSAAKVIARPQLSYLAAATSVSVAGGARTVSTGNPDLDPFEAKTLDFAVEWYPSRGAIVSVGLFHKDISTYIQNVTRIAPYATTGLPDSLLAGTGVTASDDFAISNVINTPGGPLKGVELNFQQSLDFLPVKGFGVLANYTYVHSQIDYFTSTAAGATTVTADLLNLSKNAYNATLYYEQGPFQVRGSVNYRDKFLRAVPGSFNTDVSGVPARTYYDFSASYKITDSLTVSLEGINLTNEATVTWSDSRTERLDDYREGGRQYYLGVRYNF